jgi:hypothetical protein
MPSRTAVLAAGAALSALLVSSLAGCRVDAGDINPANHTSDGEYRVDQPVTALKVTAIAGRIEVVSGSGAGVAVREHVRYDEHPPATRHRVDNGTLNLDYTCPGSNETCWVSYRVEVPGGTAVDLRSDAGEVRVTGLSGQVRARTTAGFVLGSRLTSQDVKVDSTAGSVTLEFQEPPSAVEAHTTAGAVTVRVPGTARYAVEARTSAGSTRVSVPEDSASAHQVKASSSAGSVSVLSS